VRKPHRRRGCHFTVSVSEAHGEWFSGQAAARIGTAGREAALPVFVFLLGSLAGHLVQHGTDFLRLARVKRV